MAWRRPGDKPLSEPMMVSLLTHICVTRPQWVNNDSFPGRWFDSGTWDRKIEQELVPLLELPVPEPPEEKEEEEPPAKKEPPTKKGKGAKEEKPEKGGKKKPPEKEEKPGKKEKKPKEDKPESGDFFFFNTECCHLLGSRYWDYSYGALPLTLYVLNFAEGT